MEEKIERALKLKEMISHYDTLYYDEGISEISDAEYDRLYKEYEELEKQYPELKEMADSPTRRVGAAKRVLTTLPKFTHKTPLLSIDRKAKEIEELQDFYNKCGGDGTEMLIEPKFDGITCNLNYENYKLVNAATRGNGYIGDLITDNFKNTDSVYPLEIKAEEYEIRGEAIIPYDYFKKNLEGEYSNPRNAVSGIMRQVNPEDVKGKGIEVIFYDTGVNSLADTISKESENIEFIKDSGFRCSPVLLCTNFNDLREIVETRMHGLINDEDGFNVLNGLDKFPHAVCDGLVIKVNDLKLREEIGYSEKGPKWAFAYKFKPLQAITTIIDVEWQVGKTGRVVPVANFEEVSLGGTHITKATLNNYEYMTTLPLMNEKGEVIETEYDESKSLVKGDKIIIERSNDVIPRVVGILKTGRDITGKTRFASPLSCPVCGGHIYRDGPLHFCENPLCKAQMKKKLEHFACRNAMNIVGLGESIVDQFYDLGLITTFSSIYDLKDHKEELLKLEKFGEKKVDNLLTSIENSKDVELDQFIYALSIPFIGRATAKDLARYYKDIESLIHCKRDELLSIDEFGEIMADGVYDTFQNEDFVKEIHNLLEKGVKPKEIKVSSNDFEGKTFVITGTLSHPRDFYQKIIESRGGKCASSVSKKTYAVLIGTDAGSKETKAKELVKQGINIILLEGDETVNEFLNIEG